jgi:hypothetical protein
MRFGNGNRSAAREFDTGLRQRPAARGWTATNRPLPCSRDPFLEVEELWNPILLIKIN